MTPRRLAAEQRALEALMDTKLPPHLRMAVLAAQQTLLWITGPRGFTSPAKFIGFARTLQQPHRSLYPTARGKGPR